MIFYIYFTSYILSIKEIKHHDKKKEFLLILRHANNIKYNEAVSKLPIYKKENILNSCM